VFAGTNPGESFHFELVLKVRLPKKARQVCSGLIDPRIGEVST